MKLSNVRVKIAPDLEIEVNTKPEGEADVVPGASITAYYKGVEVADALFEFQDGKLQFYINEPWGHSDEPVLLDSVSTSQLEEIIADDDPPSYRDMDILPRFG